MSSKKTRLEDIAIETFPFARQLKEWCYKYPEFRKALKIIYSERFLHLGALSTSYSPNYPNDEVIGIYAYDYRLKQPIFKQDFIINKNKNYKQFILYTRNPGGKSKWVRDINEFYEQYGKGGYYVNTHHMSLEDLPKELQSKGRQVVSEGEVLLKSTLRSPKGKHLRRLIKEIKIIKSKKWNIKEKLEN